MTSDRPPAAHTGRPAARSAAPPPEIDLGLAPQGIVVLTGETGSQDATRNGKAKGMECSGGLFGSDLARGRGWGSGKGWAAPGSGEARGWLTRLALGLR